MPVVRGKKDNELFIYFTPQDIEEAKKEKDGVMTLYYMLAEKDCYFIGDSWCWDNYHTGHTIYDFYSDLLYRFRWDWLDNELMNSKTVKLDGGLIPDEYDREMLAEEGF